MELTGARTLVTGAAGGLGSAISRELARRGAHLLVSGRNQPGLEQLAHEIGAEVVVADLTDRADVDRLAGTLADLDVLVANAGIGDSTSLDDVAADTSSLDASIDVNLRAPIRLATAFAAARLASDRPGHIVLVGSLAGLAASPNTRMYNATKFGLRGFGLSLRQELDGTGVGVSLVEPGFIRDAGMFVNSAVDLPPGVRTKSPQDVARSVARAIEGDIGEVFVAPIELRIAASFAAVAPGLSASVQRRLGVADRTAN